jgi:hypothetical protein
MGCRESSRTQQALKDLDGIKDHGPDGDIYGRVTKRVYDANSGGMSGVAVTLHGPDGDRREVTDAKGWFKAHVSPGRYAAVAIAPGWKFQSEGLAWEDAGAFTVPAGGCAEIQITATPAPSECQGWP